ncbi:hypothetical protein [Methylomonas koyamae]|uniref:hypothetical protein n=1 Tax=Methylomonas koyamae TaxID=702114 RepID=UPI0028730DD0|nr:hypothetical protein [Methylomonas koyamae]WNB77381.1 hypothetical protein RI210_07325 [Methylomonas koyamae]
MKVDFKNAAQRHYLDAELLYNNSRWANADQLYGLSSECVLKQIISGFDPNSINPLTGDFVAKSPHKKHFEQNVHKDLWNYFSINFAGRLAANHPLPNNNEFSDWDIFQRYVHASCIDQQRTEVHRAATISLQNLLQQLFTDGVIQ